MNLNDHENYSWKLRCSLNFHRKIKLPDKKKNGRHGSTRGPNYSAGYSYGAVFAIFFPAITGLDAGANMSGDLKSPAKAIPRGTLLGIGTSLLVYLVLAVMLAAGVARASLQKHILILQDLSYKEWLFAPGELCSLFASALSSIVGAARILEALARDDLLEFIKYFKKTCEKWKRQKHQKEFAG